MSADYFVLIYSGMIFYQKLIKSEEDRLKKTNKLDGSEFLFVIHKEQLPPTSEHIQTGMRKKNGLIFRLLYMYIILKVLRKRRGIDFSNLALNLSAYL